MHRVTYFPPATQRQFAKNRERIRGKPYERFFDGTMWLHDDALPAIERPMDPSLALAPTAVGVNRLLEPGRLPVETGYCAFADGSAYVASRVSFPGCTGEMFAWWFGWHAVEPERYSLWYPHNHIAGGPKDHSVLHRPGLSHEERYVGTTHLVDEYIGPDRLKLAIRFERPSAFGLDESLFDRAGIVAHACARVGLRGTGLDAVTMLHLARKTSDGFELRSHYWIANEVRLLGVPVDGIAARTGLKRRLAGARMAYEQLLHDQIEFTHLAGFLADVHRAFGPG